MASYQAAAWQAAAWQRAAWQLAAPQRPATWALIGGMLLVATAGRAESPAPLPAPARAPMELTAKKLGEMRPVHALGDVYLAGQPTPADLLICKQHGIETVITLRKRNEVAWDEGRAVREQDMRFVEVPFQQPEELKPQVFAEVLQLLRDKKQGPIVLHCASANRVGAIWYAHRVLDGKISPAAALQEAQIVGLRTPAYLERAQAYVAAAESQPVQPGPALSNRVGP